MTPKDLMRDLIIKINPQYAELIGTESNERKQCADAIELLIGQRDQLAAKLAEVEAERDYLGAKVARLTLQKANAHPAPCAGACEATAFRIEIRQLKAERDALKARLEGGG